MAKDSFDDLKKLVQSLKPMEVEAAKHFVNAFDSNITKSKNKGLKLLKLLISDPKLSRVQAHRRINRAMQTRSFDRLVIRLKDKILESFLLDINLSRSGVYENTSKTLFDSRKKIIEAHIVHARNFTSMSKEMYDKIINTTRSYEMYDELLQVLYLKQEGFGTRHGLKEFNKYQKEIDFYERCRTAQKKAKSYFYQHFIEVDRTGLNNENVAALMESISKIQVDYDYTKSASVGYRLFSLKIEYYFALAEYERCVENGYKLVETIESNMMIFKRLQKGTALINLADNELFIFDFQSSIKNSIEALSFFVEGSFNHNVSKEVEFRAKFYFGELDQCVILLQNLSKFIEETDSPYLYGKMIYYKANVLFMQKRYRESYLLLNDTREIEKDKEGWNIGRRILSIMNHIEMSLLDVADSEIESFRKHVSRIRDSHSVRKRDKIILQLLIMLERKSFHFDQVYEANQETFEKLDSAEKDYCWEIKTPEMIVFHRWFKAKALGEEYVFEIPESLIKKAKEKSKGDAALVKKQEELLGKPIEMPRVNAK